MRSRYALMLRDELKEADAEIEAGVRICRHETFCNQMERFLRTLRLCIHSWVERSKIPTLTVFDRCWPVRIQDVTFVENRGRNLFHAIEVHALTSSTIL